jgi:glucose-1-phosphate thymidylyltransferase
VANPSSYGILYVSEDLNPLKVEEKPLHSNSKLAITGLYFFTGDVCEIAKRVTPSSRGELEITSVISHYLAHNLLTYTHLNRGVAWLDTGSPQTMSDAANYVRVIEERTGLKIGCIEEISLRNGWITKSDLTHWENESNAYANYVKNLI